MDLGEARSTEAPFSTRLWWLILGRAAAVLLVVITGAFWVRGTFGPNVGDALQSIKPLIFVFTLLTLLYSAAHVLWKNHAAQARVQIFGDVVLVTWLVWITGAVHSPYTALYIVVIAVASLYIGPRGALIASVGSAVAFNSCALLLMNGVVPVSNIPTEESLANVFARAGDWLRMPGYNGPNNRRYEIRNRWLKAAAIGASLGASMLGAMLGWLRLRKKR